MHVKKTRISMQLPESPSVDVRRCSQNCDQPNQKQRDAAILGRAFQQPEMTQDQLLLSNSRQIHRAQDPAHTPASTARFLCTTGQKGKDFTFMGKMTKPLPLNTHRWHRWGRKHYWEYFTFFFPSSRDTLCQSALKSSFQRDESNLHH